MIIELDRFEWSADVRCCVWESCDDLSALLAHEVERGRSMLLQAPRNTPRRHVRGSSKAMGRCARTRLIASTVIPLFPGSPAFAKTVTMRQTAGISTHRGSSQQAHQQLRFGRDGCRCVAQSTAVLFHFRRDSRRGLAHAEDEMLCRAGPPERVGHTALGMCARNVVGVAPGRGW